MSAQKRKKLWGGRFKYKLHPRARAYSYSLATDKELLPYDIKASIAHVKTLARTNVITTQEATRLVRGLQSVGHQLARKNLSVFAKNVEDVHTLVQSSLEKRVGAVAKKLHTGRSRNDQVATATRLYVKDKLDLLNIKLTAYQKALLVFAKKGTQVAIPGYTHLQRAQVVLLAHHLLAYVAMAERDKERIKNALTRVDELPLGSGALAGVPYALNRNYTAKLLGFARVSLNSMDAVSSRDYIIEVLAALAILFTNLSRLCEDCILWNSQEFGFVSLPDEFATGSSIMPHKKNPDLFELVRGKTGTVIGHLMALLTTMKGLPLAYNRDMQEDKAPLFSSMRLAIDTLDLCAAMIPRVTINKERCLMATYDSVLYATDLMDYLVEKGISLADAHTLVGKIVLYATTRGKDLAALNVKELQKFSHVFRNDIKGIFTPKRSLASRKSCGSTHPAMVSRMIRTWQARLRKQ